MAMSMTTGTAMSTTDGPQLYRLLAWLSPSFPTGGFSYSHGLEAAVEAGRVADVATLVDYVGVALARGAGRLDAAFLAAAHRAIAADDEAAFLAAASRALATRGSAELALESQAQGEAFLATLRAAWPDPALERWARLLDAACVPAVHPVAVATAAAASGIALAPILAGFLQAFAANVVSAGVRLVPLGQTDGQRALAALEPAIAAAVDAALQPRDLAAIGSAAPLIDLLSIRHERQYARLFRS